jgi:integrase
MDFRKTFVRERAMTMTNITTAAGRRRLDPQPEPYWHKIVKGRYVGYRAGADTWVARMYLNGANAFQALDSARDFESAKAKAEAWFAELTGGAEAHYLVDDAIADYIEHRRIENGEASAHEAELMLNKRALPKFKGRELASITTDDLSKWRNSFLPKPSPDDPDPEETKRRAKDTANKHWNYLRAALALAFRNGMVSTDAPWRRLKPFGKVAKSRDFYPTAEQVADLLKHCADDLRPLVRAAALTGFRLQALTAARVGDFDPIAGTLDIKRDKGHSRTATLSTAVIALFKSQVTGKLPSAYLFVRADGYPWTTSKSLHHRPFRDACAKAELPRAFILYSLRHYAISRALLAGVNAYALAKNTGTSAAMIEKHYGKFIRSDVRDMLDRVEVA